MSGLNRRTSPMPATRVVVTSLAALLAAAVLVPAAALPASGGDGGAGGLCGQTSGDVQCGPGNGRKTVGGGEKVSHTGWPAITGILWKVLDSGSYTKAGGAGNDELLGHHGSDHLSGGAGVDVLWGDWDPKGNTTRQSDTLAGGGGGDFIYPSHGRTVVKGGAGNDHVWAFYGHGSIDCGAGHDTVRVRQNGAFRLHGCEVIEHFCAFGSNGNGGCRKPSSVRASRRPGA